MQEEKLKHTYPECPKNLRATTYGNRETIDFPTCKYCDYVYYNYPRESIKWEKVVRIVDYPIEFDKLIEE